MKYLQILNAAMLALGTSLAVCLGVVCLQYLWYLDSAPQLGTQLRGLYIVTGAFAALAAAGLVAFVAQRRRWMLRWLAQLLPVLPIVGLALFIAKARG